MRPTIRCKSTLAKKNAEITELKKKLALTAEALNVANGKLIAETLRHDAIESANCTK